MRTIIVLAALMIATPAVAQMELGPSYYQRIHEGNALRDIARAQDRQADTLRRLKRIERDQALREDREARVRNRDRRDAYRR